MKVLLDSCIWPGAKDRIAAAGRSPRSMMRFVLGDSFDCCECVVGETPKSEESVGKHGTIPNAVVQREARAIIAAVHACRRKPA